MVLNTFAGNFAIQVLSIFIYENLIINLRTFSEKSVLLRMNFTLIEQQWTTVPQSLGKGSDL